VVTQNPQPAAPAPPATLVCRLRQRAIRQEVSPRAGEVELENVSTRTIEIEYDMHPLQHLDLVVTDGVGNIVSDRPYSDRFSPLGTARVLRLMPGEKVIAPVSLLGNVPKDKSPAGCYTVQAVYRWNGLEIVSEPFQVMI
jgi:hypothetical protein